MMASALLALCDQQGPTQGIHRRLQTVTHELALEERIQSENHYALDGVEVMVSRNELRVLVSDDQLARAGASEQAATASAIVSTSKRCLPRTPTFH